VFFCLQFQANIVEVTVSIDAKFHNSLIGAKGRLVRSIIDGCNGVQIHFPTNQQHSDKVTLRGEPENVEKARQQLLELAKQKVRHSGLAIIATCICHLQISLAIATWICHLRLTLTIYSVSLQWCIRCVLCSEFETRCLMSSLIARSRDRVV